MSPIERRGVPHTDAPNVAVTRALARFAVDARYVDLPAGVRKEAVRTLVNYVGVAVGGSRHEAVEIAVAALGPFAGPPQASLFGRRERLDVMNAAFVNGVASHVLDYDDTHLATVIHPGGPVASALLAAAEHRPVAVAPAAAPSPLNTAHAVERIQAMVHVAHARGHAHAKLELHPAELGGVTIQLHVTGDGLKAHIAADRAEALPLLQRAAADLQRSLESRGIDLSALDFGLAPDAEAGASRDDGRAQQRAGAFASATSRGDGDDEAGIDVGDVLTTSTSAIELPAGALVDVRA
jgi:hypothetical protein